MPNNEIPFDIPPMSSAIGNLKKKRKITRAECSSVNTWAKQRKCIKGELYRLTEGRGEGKIFRRKSMCFRRWGQHNKTQGFSCAGSEKSAGGSERTVCGAAVFLCTGRRKRFRCPLTDPVRNVFGSRSVDLDLWAVFSVNADSHQQQS